jgi:DNA modification methylase
MANSTATAMRRQLDPAPEVDIAAFVAEHGTAYDAEVDSYQRDPLVVHGRHGKGSAIYNAHAYHTKVPPEAIKAYLEHHTSPGDLVLDPFCGSGMTGVACLLAGRNAIISDLSPAAVHIAYNYCTPVDLSALGREWARIKEEVAQEFHWLHGTTCDSCRGPATIQYTVWSDVLACPRCGTDIVLWDAAVVRRASGTSFDPPISGLTTVAGWQPPLVQTAAAKQRKSGQATARQAGDVLDSFECPNCTARLRKTECKYVRSDPVLTSYECSGPCRPKRRERAPTEDERRRIQEIAEGEPPYWVPETRFDPKREMYLRNSRTFRDQGITRVKDFWTPRNLWALASLWSRASAIEDERLARAMRFLLTPALWLGSKLYRYRIGGGGGEQGKLAISSLTRENNVANLVRAKLADITDALNSLKRNGEVLTCVSDATALNAIPVGTIDYIFTDPPFGSNIFYADCSLLWEAWLGQLMDESREAVWNKSKTPEEGGKTLDDYRGLMEQSFAEMHRVLKPGRWATVVFSNSDDRVWHAIQQAAEKAGFAIAGAGTLDKLQRSYKGVKGASGEEKVVTKDVVMNLLKPVEASVLAQRDGIPDPEGYVRDVLHTYLSRLADSDGSAPEKRTTQALYDQVVTTLLNGGMPTSGFGLTFVQSVAQESFKQVDGYWYRRGDRIQSERMLTHIADEGSAITWLDRYLGARPATEAEIIPEFNTVSARTHIAGGLTRLLRENFFFDPITRRWRVPTALERDALNDAGTEQRRARIRRVARDGGEDLGSLELLEIAENAVRLDLYPEAGRIVQSVHAPDLKGPALQRLALVRAVVAANSTVEE